MLCAGRVTGGAAGWQTQPMAWPEFPILKKRLMSYSMADLTNRDKRAFESVLGMAGGYVLNFSNRTFDEFVRDAVGINIYDDRFAEHGTSKATRLRAFWAVETNDVVARLMQELVDFAIEDGFGAADEAVLRACREAIARLRASASVHAAEALGSDDAGRDFDLVAREVRAAISESNLAAGLDRLHTYVTKYLRRVCEGRGISVGRDKPLHSLFGEYVKALQRSGEIESEMGARILKGAISVLDGFSAVRNDQSLAHDNPLLSHAESLLIFDYVASTIRFVRTMEGRRVSRAGAPAPDDIPF